MKALWTNLFYEPLYNALVFLVDIFPGHSLFFAVIVLTIIVRLIIAPLSYKSIKTQLQTKALQPKLRKLKEDYPDKQEQAKKTLELYREYGVNPFSGFLLLLVQFPIIIALYLVFRDGGVAIDPDMLYSFVSFPEQVSLTSFGLDLSQKSYLLAFLTGFSQYIYLSISSAFRKSKEDLGEQSEQERMMSMVGSSMKYSMPIMITIFAYIIGGAVALYWVSSNIFMIVQELYIQRKLKKEL